MKDIFDEIELGKLKLQSRIIRTGLWESQSINGRLTSEVYTRYENIAKSGVGLITTELISLYKKNKLNEYAHKIYNPNLSATLKK